MASEDRAVMVTIPKLGVAMLQRSRVLLIGCLLVCLWLVPDLASSRHALAVPMPEKRTKAQLSRRPAAQTRFIQIAETYSATFEATPREQRSSQLAKARGLELLSAVPDRFANSWIGTVTKIQTDSDGTISLAVSVSPTVQLKTWNNAFSDLGAGTRIRKEQPLHATLRKLTQGQTIRFSGRFFSSDEADIREVSVTMDGSMHAPEFLFAFDKVLPLHDTATTAVSQ